MTVEEENMTYRAHQTNKKNGVTYVYDVVSVWHKELGQARNQRTLSRSKKNVSCSIDEPL